MQRKTNIGLLQDADMAIKGICFADHPPAVPFASWLACTEDVVWGGETTIIKAWGVPEQGEGWPGQPVPAATVTRSRGCEP